MLLLRTSALTILLAVCCIAQQTSLSAQDFSLLAAQRRTHGMRPPFSASAYPESAAMAAAAAAAAQYTPFHAGQQQNQFSVFQHSPGAQFGTAGRAESSFATSSSPLTLSAPPSTPPMTFDSFTYMVPDPESLAAYEEMRRQNNIAYDDMPLRFRMKFVPAPAEYAPPMMYSFSTEHMMQKRA